MSQSICEFVCEHSKKYLTELDEILYGNHIYIKLLLRILLCFGATLNVFHIDIIVGIAGNIFIKK